MSRCIFCNISKALINSSKSKHLQTEVFYNDRYFYCIADLKRTSKNPHWLIIPHSHFDQETQLSQSLLKHLVMIINKLINKYNLRSGQYIVYKCGKTIRHLHVHFIVDKSEGQL